MVGDARSYSDVVQQISAAIAALESVTQVIVDDLVEATISKAEKRELKESVRELREVIQRSA
jgi:DNA-binding FrmR family transcriptional regulator